MSGVLVKCTGNICRSPMAEGLLRAAPERHLGADAPPVSSAGVSGLHGTGATPNAIAVAAERGVDVAAHRVRILTRSLLADADVVACMARRHREEVVDLDPAVADRAFTIAELVRPLEAAAAGRSVADRLADLTEPLAAAIAGARV